MFFSSSIYIEEELSFLENFNKHTNSYIENSRNKNKQKMFNNRDFGLVHHSDSLLNDLNFFNFIKLICKKSYNILDKQGYDLSNFLLVASEMWVQEFSKEGGGFHSLHTHWNGHISGFYFLKCSDKTSFPIFHDPRPGKMMIQLPEKNENEISDSSEKIIFKPKPGTLVFFNSYLPHEFVVDQGVDPFRFIHFNVQAIQKRLINGDIKKIN